MPDRPSRTRRYAKWILAFVVANEIRGIVMSLPGWVGLWKAWGL